MSGDHIPDARKMIPTESDRETRAAIWRVLKEALDGGEFNVDANDEKVLQILAQHAQQARLEERERCAAYIEGRMQLAHDGFDLTGFEPHNAKCRAFATAIRKGEAA